jgi:hypothetical protein
MSDPESEARATRIAQLEARLGRRAPVGVMPPVAALALVIAGWVIWLQYDDVAYFFSSREPISLGVEGAYRFDQAQSNRYAQLHGEPTVRGAYGVEGSQHFVVIGVQNTPLLVKRNALPTEEWKPGTTPPPPDKRSFTASGRLLSRADASRWSDAFEKHESYGEINPKWLLIEGARPGSDLGAMGWFGLVIAFAAINLWLLIRGVLAMLAARRPTA